VSTTAWRRSLPACLTQREHRYRLQFGLRWPGSFHEATMSPFKGSFRETRVTFHAQLLGKLPVSRLCVTAGGGRHSDTVPCVSSLNPTLRYLHRAGHHCAAGSVSLNTAPSSSLSHSGKTVNHGGLPRLGLAVVTVQQGRYRGTAASECAEAGVCRCLTPQTR
jgi:hypothetical protein